MQLSYHAAVDDNCLHVLQVSMCDLGGYHGNKTQPSHCNTDDPLVDRQALVNSLITAVAPLPANLWTIFYMDKLGRKFFLGMIT